MRKLLVRSHVGFPGFRNGLTGPIKPNNKLLGFRHLTAGAPSNTILPASFQKFSWPHYDTGIEGAYTPSSSWYTDKDFLHEIEAKVTFPKNWLIVGRIDQLPNEGDYLAGNVMNKHPFVVVKQENGQLKGFYNVCRHHAAQLVDDGIGSLHTTQKRFRCPYHGWQYTADGKLAVATSIKGCLGFKPKDNGLVDILVDTLGPWIFVRLDKEGSKGSLLADQPDMETFFGMLQTSDYMSLVHVKSKSYVINCNYKVYMDNYLDGGYHVPVAHPALNDSLNFESYKRSGSRNYYLQTCAPDDEKATTRVGAGKREALYIFHYPNFCVNRYGDWMDTNIVWPLGHDKCRVDFDWFITKDKSSDLQYIEESILASDKVQEEDIWLCERVQKGLDSPCFGNGGRYAPLLEGGEYMYHRRLYEDVLTAAGLVAPILSK